MIPRFTAGYLSALNLQPTMMTGFSDNVTLGADRRNQEKSRRCRCASRLMAIPPALQDVHWRGIVFTNFDGRRWFTPNHDPTVVSPNGNGVFS